MPIQFLESFAAEIKSVDVREGNADISGTALPAPLPKFDLKGSNCQIATAGPAGIFAASLSETLFA